MLNGAAGASNPNPAIKRSYDEGPGHESSDGDGDANAGTATKSDDAPSCAAESSCEEDQNEDQSRCAPSRAYASR